MVQFYIHEYSRYKTGIIHEYSRIYTMNRIILEYSWIIHVHESRAGKSLFSRKIEKTYWWKSRKNQVWYARRVVH